MQHLYDQVAVTLVIVKYKTNTSWANLALFGGQNSCQRIHITWNNKKTWGKGREGKGREGKGREGKGREITGIKSLYVAELRKQGFEDIFTRL